LFEIVQIPNVQFARIPPASEFEGMRVAKPGKLAENEPSEQRTVSKHEQVDGSFWVAQPSG
jgi:hypothetical protein